MDLQNVPRQHLSLVNDQHTAAAFKENEPIFVSNEHSPADQSQKAVESESILKKYEVESMQDSSNGTPGASAPDSSSDSNRVENAVAIPDSTNAPVSLHEVSLARSDSTGPVEALEKMVVTATRTLRRLSQTSASVSIIDRAQIDASSAKNIDDLLKTKPGIQIKRPVGLAEGIPSDIIIRGIPGSLGSSRMLTLVDGMPTNASGTPFLFINEVPLEAIRSIEVVRGPYSSLYGANAFSGVVNVLTKEITTTPEMTAVFETTYPFLTMDQYLSNDISMRRAMRQSLKQSLWSGSATAGGGNQTARLFASAGLRSIGNYFMRDSAMAKKVDTIHQKSIDNHDYYDVRALCKAAVNAGGTEISLQTRYYANELGFGKTSNLAVSRDIITKGQKIIIGPEVKLFPNDMTTIVIGGFIRRLIGEFYNEGKISSDLFIPTYWKSTTIDWQMQTTLTFDLKPDHTIIAGADFLSNGAQFGAMVNDSSHVPLPNSLAKDVTIMNGGAFIQDEMFFFDRHFIFIPGIRGDYHSTFGGVISPKLGMVYNVLKQLRLRSSFGYAFRAPTLSELYMPDVTMQPNVIFRGNPAVKPEHLWTVECGIDDEIVPQLKTGVCFFSNQMHNLISNASQLFDTAAKVAYISFFNVEKEAWSAGVEMNLEWQAREWLFLEGQYTFQRSQDTKRKVALDYIPENLFSLAVKGLKEFSRSKALLQMQGNYVSSRTYLDWNNSKAIVDPEGNLKIIPPAVALKSYFILDAMARFTVAEKYWLALNVQNLFNRVYEESGGTYAPGRFMTLKFGVSY
ncbi:MAG: TonB-dependent receptor [Chitinivibrionales bacterium]|nr:TonB-dependent receptor [Chitinivibrionales bacterium]